MRRALHAAAAAASLLLLIVRRALPLLPRCHCCCFLLHVRSTRVRATVGRAYCLVLLLNAVRILLLMLGPAASVHPLAVVLCYHCYGLGLSYPCHIAIITGRHGAGGGHQSAAAKPCLYEFRCFLSCDVSGCCTLCFSYSLRLALNRWPLPYLVLACSSVRDSSPATWQIPGTMTDYEQYTNSLSLQTRTLFPEQARLLPYTAPRLVEHIIRVGEKRDTIFSGQVDCCVVLLLWESRAGTSTRPTNATAAK